MSGDQAFFSFCNYIRSALEDSGMSVYIGKNDSKTAPYLVLQNLSEDIEAGWISNQMCQGWVVVEAVSGEPLEVTAARYKNVVLAATRDIGAIAKYDYEQTPTVQVGTLIAKVTGISPDLSNDPQRSKRVITWELLSNSAN